MTTKQKLKKFFWGPTKAERQQLEGFDRILENSRQLFWAVLVVTFLRSSIIESYRVPTPSMVPTVMNGDFLFVNKFAYGLKLPWPFSEGLFEKNIFLWKRPGPKRGDVIVFKYPKDPETNFIKRVVGIPGDTLEIRDDTLYVNDVSYTRTPKEDRKIMKTIGTVGMSPSFNPDDYDLFEEQIESRKHNMMLLKDFPGNDFFQKITIPEGYYFCMGDNRDNSHDSRAWGFVPADYVKGKALIIWFSFNMSFRDSPNPMDWDIDFRPYRIFNLLN